MPSGCRGMLLRYVARDARKVAVANPFLEYGSAGFKFI